jgi:putative redox protein
VLAREIPAVRSSPACGVAGVSELPPDFLENISAGRHGLQADEPLSAPEARMPPRLPTNFSSRQGACKVITVRMYAKRKRWPLQGVR